jgi:hypothetical protein
MISARCRGLAGSKLSQKDGSPVATDRSDANVGYRLQRERCPLLAVWRLLAECAAYSLDNKEFCLAVFYGSGSQYTSVGYVFCLPPTLAQTMDNIRHGSSER